MILIPIFLLFVGVMLGLAWDHPLTGVSGQYLAIACLGGFDTICGGIRSGLEGKFRTDVFVTGFVSNVVIAFTLAWIGDRIFIDLHLAVALVLGARIFNNLSLIRRYMLTRVTDARERKRLERIAAEAQNTVPAQSSAHLGQAEKTA